jgi:neutral ceramidase
VRFSTVAGALVSILSLGACSSPTPPSPDVAQGDAADAATSDIVAPDASDDVAQPDASPPVPASIAHCTFEPMPSTARAGTMVTEGSVRAGASEVVIEMPVGTVLGGYQGRSSRTRAVDMRDVPSADVFMPSVGIETRPMAKALAITGGDETVVLLSLDLPLNYDTIVSDVERALGAEFNGKVIVGTNHSHGSPGQFTANPVISLGLGRFQRRMYQRVIDASVQAAREALMARVDARVGFAHDGMFDPMDRVSRDRRPENDAMAGGRRKDRDLYVLRVEARDGTALAMVNVFGVHGTVLGDANALMTTEVTGAIERAVEETFDRRVVVMHLQGAAGDVSPSGDGMIDCSGVTGNVQCSDFARIEAVGRAARDSIRAAWDRAGASMRETLSIESVTRSVSLGPDWSTFAVRDGARRLEYAPFRRNRLPDGMIFGAMGAVLSPVDEFNAPHGAGLCGGDNGPLVPTAALPGVSMLRPYRSCIDVQRGSIFVLGVGNIPEERSPFCASTRTQVTAMRIGDLMLATLPGEPVTLLADALRARSPMPPERTVVIGYAQGHIGYLLTPEDWLQGGYEPNINLWGPLEGEYLVEQTAALMTLANTAMREDAAMGAAPRLPSPMSRPDTLAPPEMAMGAGTVPATVPAEVFVRGRRAIARAQPATSVPRMGLATFVWLGDDPQRQNARVRLERESAPMSGVFAPVLRRSGRAVSDQDLLLTWTPFPLRAVAGQARSHYWAVEWQAVTPQGTSGLDAIEDRAGVALGRYRFHVEGAGWTLDSEPFSVVAGALSVSAMRSGTSFTVSAGYEARDGWRLIAPSGAQNRRVALRQGPVRVTFEMDMGAPRSETVMALSATGTATIDFGMQADRVRRIVVRDRFDNEGAATP